MNFYTNVQTYGNNILYRGYEDGQRVQYKDAFRPSLFVPSNKTNTKYRTMHGKSVEEIQPGSIKDCRDFVKEYAEVKNFEIFGNTRWEHQYIASLFPNKEDASYDMNILRVMRLDIETESEEGFPRIPEAQERINVITLDVHSVKYVFALGKVNIPNVELKCFDDEKSMLLSFVEKFKELDCDVITGWNIRFFDIPYIICRLNKLFGEDFAKQLSPWKSIRQDEVEMWGKSAMIFEIEGISTLDFYELYQKYTPNKRENYKLGYIAQIELGITKVDHAEYETFKDFYTQNFQKFVEYNIQDVEIVRLLDQKLNLIELHISQAYIAKINFMEVFSQVRTWDAIIYNHLDKHNIVIPQKHNNDKAEQYAGAYVKEPLVGMHKWIVSFDLASLYPSLIMELNVSPDTIVDDHCSLSIDKLVEKTENTDIAKTLGYSLAANGRMFSKHKQGFLSELMEKMYNERKKVKNKMIEEQKKLEIIKDEMKKRGIS